MKLLAALPTTAVGALLAAPLLLTAPPVAADTLDAIPASFPRSMGTFERAPLFDMDTDACYPSAFVSSAGVVNGGAELDADTKACQDPQFLAHSNTYYRRACTTASDKTYCAHMYMLYFLRDYADQTHDFEYALVWTADDVTTHVSASQDGWSDHYNVGDALVTDGHPLLVVHRSGNQEMRLARKNHDEQAENPMGMFVLPKLLDWCTASADGGIDSAALRRAFTDFEFVSKNGDERGYGAPIIDSMFLGVVNDGRPDGYPKFPQEAIVCDYTQDKTFDFQGPTVLDGRQLRLRRAV